MALQITIIGLGKIGASIGLALTDQKDLIRRIGVDHDASVARMAEKNGAVDQLIFNLPTAVRQADIIALTEPLPQCRETFASVIQDAKPGAVIMDFTPVKVEQSQWASQLLPAERYFVSLTPGLNPVYLKETSTEIEAAHRDLFKNSTMIITAPTGASEEALRLTADLVNLLGAAPLFGDPYEVDGLAATTALLPKLTSAALLQATTPQPGWKEARKIAGPDYYSQTALVTNTTESQNLINCVQMDRENVSRVLADLIETLSDLHEAVSTGDDRTLQAFLEGAVQQKETWLSQRRESNWDQDRLPQANLPSSGFLSKLFGLRKPPEKKK